VLDGVETRVPVVLGTARAGRRSDKYEQGRYQKSVKGLHILDHFVYFLMVGREGVSVGLVCVLAARAL
jgi:hypothetical protein